MNTSEITGNTSEIIGSNGHSEGKVARGIEAVTSKVPSDLFLWTGIAAIALAAGAFISGKKQVGVFVGQWVPTVLLFGVYNKIVKVAGHGKAHGV